MQTPTQFTWEKLALELESLSVENPNSVVPLLVGLNSLLTGSEQQESCFRTLNFMSYELATKCDGLNESDRFHILNDYFFSVKGFQLRSTTLCETTEPDFLIKKVLTDRAGHPLPLALIYLHLATNIDLPIYLVNLPQQCILKWVRSGKSDFVDLSLGGKLLAEDELLSIINHSTGGSETIESSYLDILPAKDLMLRYLSKLSHIYRQSGQNHQLHLVMNVALKVEPSNMNYLGQRALLRRQLGMHEDALADLKRYFSFTNRENASAEIKMAYYELKALNDAVFTPADLLH